MQDVKKLIIFAVLFWLTAFTACSGFRETGLNNQPVNQNNTAVVSLRSQPPDFFADNAAEIYTGISDPGCIDSVFAVKQALHRAMFQFAMKKGTGKVMSDYFTNAQDKFSDNHYEDLFTIQCNAILPAKTFSRKIIWLNTGECILMLERGGKSEMIENEATVNVSMEIYNKESVSGNQVVTLGKSSVHLTGICDSGEFTDDYIYKYSGNNKMSIESILGGKINDFSNCRCFYPDFPEKMSVENQESGKTVLYGLWFALLNGMISKLSSDIQNQYQTTKTVGDQYQSTILSLNRNTGYFSFSWNLKRFIIQNNNLYVISEENLFL